MQLPGRIAAAIEVLSDIKARHRPAAVALKDWGAGHRFAGSGDRAAIGNLVYDALRKRASHKYAMGADTPRALVLSVVVRDWGEDIDALNASFAVDRFAPEPISSDEAERLTNSDPLKDAPEHVVADIPEWMVSSFKEAFGDLWIAEGMAMALRPPLDLRVNTLRSGRDRVMKALQRFKPEAMLLSQEGIRIPAGTRHSRTPNVQADEAYLKGWFEVQDQGSQLVAALVGAKPGEQVLDLCAGAGGKTLALAAAMENKGQIFAYDADRNRLAPIYDRLKRNTARNVQVRAPKEGALDNLVGKMDRVVVDAPCTGTGTWRRRPDAKWKLTQEQLEMRQSEQAEILKHAAKYVRPGGQLTYISCSLLPQENAQQVEKFIKAQGEFTVTSLEPMWNELVAENDAVKPHINEWGLTLTPASCSTDGFFISTMVRAIAGS